ncbi:MAG: hypothetical protein ACI4EH_12205 [Oliverpabstia sp.]
MAEEMFKATLMGGFDKDDVLAKVQRMKDEAYAEKNKLIKAGKDKDKKIEALKRQLNLKDMQREEMMDELRAQHENELNELRAQHENELNELRARHKNDLNELRIQHENDLNELRQRLRIKEEQKDRLERDISVKYQKYIDRYDLIGNLVLESQEKAERIIVDAEQKRDMLMEEARVEAQKCLDAVQSEVDEKLAEGKRKYIAVQEEMNEIVELINQAQRRFMASYREVHQIISSMPESMRELEDEVEEEHNKKQAVDEIVPEIVIRESYEENQDSLDEEDDDMIEEQLIHILHDDEEE